MNTDILLGLQWGDEGKGKVVDLLTPHYDIVARFQGGPNAGHTLEFDGKKVVLRSIPSGIFQGNINIIGNGVVLDPILFAAEVAEIEQKYGLHLQDVLKISKKAHLILPSHRLQDAASEQAKGAAKIGTTGKGIGPAYTDKISRNGIRVGDILRPDFDQVIAQRATPDPTWQQWLNAINILKSFDLIDSEVFINRSLDQGKSLLCEGAQGTMLDVDFGSYPFVTSSNTIAAGACSGLGIAPNRIRDVYGIFKAYCTRVGSGPFPTELFDQVGASIRDRGHEFGAVTGRERRCGWLDLVALKYACIINGVTKLIMMKSDVLDGFDTIRVCTAYNINGTITSDFPYSLDDSTLFPVYTDLQGWKSCTDEQSNLTPQLSAYIKFIENFLNRPIVILSVGPDRTQTINL